MEKNSRKDCLIVGGGLSGLVAATRLQSQGIQVKVLDKGRGIGGRLATRRMNHSQYREGIFDYGVQYITAESEVFQEWLNQWQKLGIVDVWGGAANTGEASKQPKYIGLPNIRSLAKHLASPLDVQTRTKVMDLKWTQGGWTVATDDCSQYDSNLLMITAPLPQSLQLLQHSQLGISESSWEKLTQVSYRMCLAVLLLVSEPILLGQGGSYHVKGEKLDWIACNYQKGISPNGYAVTLHGNAKFSEEHSEKQLRDVAAQELMVAAKEYLGNASVIDYQTHFWRYSTPMTQFPEPFFSWEDSLYLAGDAFLASNEPVSSLESAFLSGWEVANSIAAQYSEQ